ncbi:MAG: hypothetical protein OXM03_11310 [Chloroflexota bacterium]|nr:hypothetical protein [Chloroflexota bacterium]MDE2841203.1 hypothetical protein [Chloroflexota bacterium]MDE2929603.1 hypothetical protein [Chloroflexota bacterium]
MNPDPQLLYERLAQATVEEQALVLRFLLGKRTAALGRASPHLDLFLGELQIELPGAIELLGDLRFNLGPALHGEVSRWAQGKMDSGPLYQRVLGRFRVLFCDG